MVHIHANIGYKRNCIDIKISKDGSNISISGEKPIQEMVMMGWVMQRKVVDVKGFNKVFKIPYGVNLDKIKGNYNEEEWILNILMPKLVKGICGLKIEEVKEQEFDKRSELEKSEIDHVSSSVGETSQKGSKDSEFQHMEGSENNIEKMLDDNKKEINEESIQKEFGESKLRSEDGNGEKDDDIKRDKAKCTIEKENEESKLKIEDNKVKDIREKNGKEAYEVLKTLEIEKDVGKGVGETSQKGSKDYDIEHMETIQKEVGEYKLRTEDGNGEKGRVNDGKEQYEVMKKSELDQSVGMELNVVDHIPNNIDSISQSEFGEPKVPQLEKTKSDEGKMNGGGSKKLPFEANEDVPKTKFGDIIQTGIIRPELESQDEDQECVREKLGKEGFDDAKITIEEFDKYLPKKNPEAREGLNFQKMEENKDVKENVVKRKRKEIEYLEEKDDDKRLKRMHVEAKKGNTKEITQEEIEEIHDNGVEESGKQPVVEIEGSKGINVAKEESQREFMKEALVETQCLMESVEGEASKEKTKVNRVQDEEDKIDYGLVKLKGQGSRKLNVEPNEHFEEDTNKDKIEKETRNPKFQENVDIGIFDGWKTQKFQEMEQKEEFKENGENIEKSMKKLNEDKYQQIQNEEIGNSKQKEFGELECETKDRLEESSIEPFDPTKASKLEQNVVDHIPSNIGCINQNEFKEEYENPPFEVKEVVQKTMFGDIIKPKMETEDGDQECVGEKPKKEGFDAKITINEEFSKNLPKSTHEENQRLNVQKMQETKDVIESVDKRKGKKIECFVEKNEGERLKRMHIEGKKGNNTRETMQEEIEENDNGIKESGQQHAKEIIVREKSEVSRNVSEELQHPVENVDGSNEFNCAKEEEQKEVIKEALTESGSLMEKVEEEKSKDRTMAKRVEDEENKIEYAIVKLKGEGSTKLNVEPNEPFEGDTTRDKFEKDIISQKVQENDEIGIFDERKTNKFQEMEETELAKERDATIEKSMKKVNGVDEGFKKNISKEKDDCYLEEEMSKERSKEDFPKEILDSPADTMEGVKGGKIKKAKGIKEESEKVVTFVKGEKYEKLHVELNGGFRNDTTIEKTQKESEEPKIPKKIKDHQCLQENEPNDHEIEKAKKVKGKVEKNKSDGLFFADSTTKEEHQGSEIERNSQNIFEVQKENDPKAIEPRTHERELQCARGSTTYSTVESIGFKEFEYGSAKDKKQKTKVLPPKFQNKETHESKDESMSPRKSQEVGEHCTHDITSTKEVESIEDKVVKPLSTLRIQSIQQSQVEEKDKFCEGNKENYKGSIESKKEDPTKDIQNLIEMKETLKPGIPLEKELKKGEKGEFHDGEKVVETMQMETDEPKNTIDTKEKQHLAKVVAEKMDKGKCFDEKMKTTQEKEAESLESSQKNDIEEMKANRPLEEMPDLQCEFPKTKEHVRAPEVRDAEQHGYIKDGMEEIKAPKIKASERAKPSKLQSPRFNQQSTNETNRKPEFAIEEHKETKESPKLNIVETKKINSLQPRILDEQEVLDVPNFQTQKTLEEEKVVKRREGPKISKTEETKDASTLKKEKGKTTQTTEEKKPKIMETTPQFDMASGSKKASKKMQLASKRGYQRESEQGASKTDVEPPTTVEKTQIKKVEGKKHIQVLEATISKEKEDRDQQYVQEKNDKKGFQTPKIVEEEKVSRKWKGPNVDKKEEEKKHKIKEIIPQFDKASGSKRVAEEVHETPERENQRELKVTSKIEVEPPTTVEKKEPHELTRPGNMNNDIPEMQVQEKKDRERHILVPEATISKEGTLVTTTYPKENCRVAPKGEIGKPPENQTPSPKEPFQSTEGSTSLEVVEDKEAQQFEVEEEDRIKKRDSKMDVQESTKSETGLKFEENILKKRGSKDAKSENKEKKPQRMEISTQFDKVCGSKRLAENVHEKVHETPDREHQRESKEVTSKTEVELPTTVERKEAHGLKRPPNMNNEIPKVEEKEVERHIHALEATVSKEKDRAEQKEVNTPVP